MQINLFKIVFSKLLDERVNLFNESAEAKFRLGLTENPSDAAKCDSKLLHKYHFEMIAREGIFFLPGKLGAISNAHSDSDIKKMINASDRFSAKL